MKNTIKNDFLLLQTDFYQLTMTFAYIMENKANTISGYEGFIRRVKSETNPNKDFYIFSGSNEVKDFMQKIRKELKSPLLKQTFFNLIKDKIKIENWEEEFSEKWDKLDTDFNFNVIKEGSYVFPYVPVFQYKGPRWIGQLIETAVTNIYNGKTGLSTVKYMKEKKGVYITNNDIEYIESIVENIAGHYYERYVGDLKTRAKEYKIADTDGILLEAAFRRAPSKEAARIASKIAIRNGWNGTSNTTLSYELPISKIGGTMAHAFIMSYKSELEAFKAWNKIFPNSTILIDTYNTINATNILIQNNIKPAEVRIDSGDFFEIVPKVRDILDKAGWKDVGIFISGDITPEILFKLRTKEIQFTKSMAGTHYVYCNELIKKANTGFVYKIVEYKDDNGHIQYPEKKSDNKSNYTGLKNIRRIGDNKYEIFIDDGKMNIEEVNNFNEDTIIEFV